MIRRIVDLAVHFLGGIGRKKILTKIIKIFLAIIDKNINFCDKKLFNFFYVLGG